MGWALCDEAKSGGKDCGKMTYIYNTTQRWLSETATFMSPGTYYDTLTNPIAVARYLNVIDKTLEKTADLAFNGSDAEDWGKLGGTIIKELPIARRIMLEKALLEEVNTMY